MSSEGEKKPSKGSLGSFEPRGKQGPIEDRGQYEQRFNSLPLAEKQLAQESTRFADICQYFSQHRIDLPAEVVERVQRLRQLSLNDRVGAMKDVNRDLMEYLNDVDPGTGIRQ